MRKFNLKIKKTQKKLNNDTIYNIQDLHANFPKISPQWNIIFASSYIKLRRILVTENNFYSASQEVLIYQNKLNNLYNLNVSTPNEIIVDEINDFECNEIQKIFYKNTKILNVKLKSEILNSIISIEKNCSNIEAIKRKGINHLDISSDLIQLAKTEENNGNEKMSTFYKFQNEQIIMNNTTFVKRVYPENSFTVTCGFQLHNKSSNHYEKIRKSIPFILLPDKRTLFDINQKAAIPVNCFYSSKKSCPHCNILKKISKIISESSKCKICKPKSKFHTNFMALHIDEINIQCVHLF